MPEPEPLLLAEILHSAQLCHLLAQLVKFLPQVKNIFFKVNYIFIRTFFYQRLIFFVGVRDIRIRCLTGGSWDREYIPVCQTVYCGPVPQIDNGFAVEASNVTFKVKYNHSKSWMKIT